MPQSHRLIESCLLAAAASLICLSPGPAAAGGWTALPNAPVATRHEDVFFVNPDRGWIVNAGGSIYRTSDGGDHWELQWQEPVYFRSLGFANELKGSLIDCYFFDENTGFVVGGIGPTFSTRRGVVLATTNGGTTWETRHTTSRTAEWCWKISFVTPAIGYVSIERNIGSAFFLKTKDGGRTWEEVFFIDDYDEQGIGFATPTLGWIGGRSGPTYETTDEGASWHPAGFGQRINRFRFLSGTLGYAVGETVYKYAAGVAGVPAEASPGASLELALAQNHPNPFSRSTSISFVLAHDTEVKLTIQDVQGRRIRTLVEGRKPAGKHELAWNSQDDHGTPVSAGVYFYQLEDVQGSLIQVRKLLVIK